MSEHDRHTETVRNNDMHRMQGTKTQRNSVEYSYSSICGEICSLSVEKLSIISSATLAFLYMSLGYSLFLSMENGIMLQGGGGGVVVVGTRWI